MNSVSTYNITQREAWHFMQVTLKPNLRTEWYSYGWVVLVFIAQILPLASYWHWLPSSPSTMGTECSFKELSQTKREINILSCAKNAWQCLGPGPIYPLHGLNKVDFDQVCLSCIEQRRSSLHWGPFDLEFNCPQLSNVPFLWACYARISHIREY
jgi:hypothetical protein